RKLHLRAGYSSLRDWCVDVLGLSEDAAYKRIQAARAARRVPAILPLLASGELTLSAVVSLAPVITPRNARELLAAAARKTKRQIQSLVAERFPQADLPERVRRIATQCSLVPEPVAPCDACTPAPSVEPLAPPTPPAPRGRTTPLALGRIGWQLTVDAETQSLFEELKSLLAHVVPTGDMASVIKRALVIALAQERRRKFATGVKCRTKPTIRADRTIPDAVKQAVIARDGEYCSYVGDGGRRCGSRWRLELDHVVPVALGGPTSVENLRVLCRRHNQFEAERLLHGERHSRGPA
ncbi:MAG: HNH endonuclease, partial [Phycisphaerales bacterium]|nr:HNH endonuclease [Phycisphaerales bacterium]